MIDQRPASPSLTEVSGITYGVRIEGRLPAAFQPYLRSVPPTTAGRATPVEVAYRTAHGLPEVDEIWVAEPGPQTRGRLALFREPAGFGLTVDCEGSGLFRITPEAITIEWLQEGSGAAHYFFSYALPLWLESRGVSVLHASAVAFGNRAVAFVGQSGIGKSTLSAGLVRSGCPFVADDGLPLSEDEHGDWHCAQGPPWFRLWPSALERHLGLSARELPRVQDSLEKRLLSAADAADRAAEDLTLAAVYLLEGREGAGDHVHITGCTARESLVCLIEHSLAGGPLDALGLSAARMTRLSRLATRTPVRRLRLPEGSDRWPLVRKAIVEDLAAGDSSPAARR